MKDVVQGRRQANKIVEFATFINARMPSLTYYGLAFWMAWNTIGFSGSFWLNGDNGAAAAEHLLLIHLFVCFVTQIIFAVYSARLSAIVIKNWFTLFGGALATVGTFLECSIYNIAELAGYFNLACVFTGVGTTILFLRAAVLYGALPPQNSIMRFAESMLVATITYFVLAALPNSISTSVFIALPLIGAVLFGLRWNCTPTETKVLNSTSRMSPKMIPFIISIFICTVVFEISKAFITIYTDSEMIAGRTSITCVFILIVMMIIIAMTKTVGEHITYSRVLVGILLILLILLAIMASMPTQDNIVADIALAAFRCFDLVMWSMLAYIVFQAESNAVQIFSIGNCAVSGGTALGGIIMFANYNLQIISQEDMRLIFLGFGSLVLIVVTTFMSEKRVNALLLPVDESRILSPERELLRMQESAKSDACNYLATEYSLSPKESMVLRALADGLKAQEIADKEVLSIYTIRAHMRSIYAKTGVHSAQELYTLIRNRINNSHTL